MTLYIPFEVRLLEASLLVFTLLARAPYYSFVLPNLLFTKGTLSYLYTI